METIFVHGAPSEYVLETGILNRLEDKLLERGFKKVLIVHGEKSWAAAKPYWPTLKQVEAIQYQYHGENSLSGVLMMRSLVSAAERSLI